MFMPTCFGTQLDPSLLSDTINDVLAIATRLLDTRFVAVSRVEGATCTVMAVIDKQRRVRPGTTSQLDDTLCARMLEQNQPLQIDDVRLLPAASQVAVCLLDIPIEAYLGVPLRLEVGRVFGSLWAAHEAPYQFSPADVRMLSLLARLLTHEIEAAAAQRHHKRIEQVMATQANIDPMTGLFSRDGFLHALAEEAAWRHQFPHAYTVAVLGLGAYTSADPRKTEAVHQGFADMLMRTARLVDYCGRIDDLSYAVLLPNTTVHESQDWQQRIRAEVDAWNRVHRSVNMTFDVTLGIADSHEAPGWNHGIPAVLERAQQRMREVKNDTARE
jgi:GGDEF domain-containing protein